MAYWKDEIKAKDLKLGTTADVTSTFCFKMSDKAITPDQAISLNLDAPKKGTVWAVEMCNSKLDRHGEVFTKPVLDEFAKQINAASITFNLFHDRQLGIGRVLQSAIVAPEMDGSFTLKGYVWIKDVNIPELDYPVSEAITDGIYKDVSVEVSGTVRYIENPQGGYGVWEYYVDPERPERTEITGLALVQKGAQRGAGIVKSINGGKAPENESTKIKNMQHFSDKFLVGGELMAFKTVDAGGAVTIEGLQPLIDKTNKAITDLAAANTAKDAAIAEKAAIETEANTLKAAIVTELTGLQLALKMATPKTVTELEALKAADLITMRTDLLKQFEGIGDTRKAVDAVNKTVKDAVSALPY